MGFWRDVFLGTPAPMPSLTSPFSPQDSLEAAVIGDLWAGKAGAPAILTRDTALRLPAVKRSHDITCGVLARMQWKQYDNAAQLAAQPTWLVNSQTGIAPRNLRWGVVSDLFMGGWAVIGFELGEDGYPIDALHIPAGWWTVETDGTITVNDAVAPRFRQRVIAISLGYGSNGMLVDGRDSINDGRIIEASYRDRIENPIAQTVLTIEGARWDGWSKREREDFRKLWIQGRQAASGATALKPDWVSADYSGNLPADLFESGRNANRLDIANHAGIPADMLEGSKQGGGSNIHYSTEVGGASRNELWDFGLAKYADAIESRLSLDDVCRPGESIRVDTGDYLTSPTPAEPPTSED